MFMMSRMTLPALSIAGCPADFCTPAGRIPDYSKFLKRLTAPFFDEVLMPGVIIENDNGS